LPSHAHPEERLLAKEARKEARRAAKGTAVEKRKEKFPKHLKKMAVKKERKIEIFSCQRF